MNVGPDEGQDLPQTEVWLHADEVVGPRKAVTPGLGVVTLERPMQPVADRLAQPGGKRGRLPVREVESVRRVGQVAWRSAVEPSVTSQVSRNLSAPATTAPRKVVGSRNDPTCDGYVASNDRHTVFR
ncbi:hypothetical protein ACGF5C_33275 [Micromonospora sp. NPDC047620]|uniref:hypothetical protein n=1 Tax=Micromonospora sp. NPDC047620 TaxID=3364251 RepID=UPI00371F2E07